MFQLKSFIVGVIQEMRHKVTWPPYSQLQHHAFLVLVGSFIFSIVVGLIDLFSKGLITWFYNNF